MSLPIEEVLPDLRLALRERDEAVVVAEPGAGKTTRIPLALLTEPWLQSQRILMLEPRRIAAKLAAQRLAESLGEKPGGTVGYRMRLESCVSDNTRILIVTEGVLTRMLQSDPSLDGIGLLIFDEYHERSIDADLGLALSLYARDLFREQTPLKILVMSATLDAAVVSALLNHAPVIHSQGRSFPVEVRYHHRIERRDLTSAVAAQVRHCLASCTGSILVFLPGQGEILAVQRLLEDGLEDERIVVAPLYGALPLEAQQQAVRAAPEGFRKIVLATDIAESSLTIEGISVVVDGGWARKPEFDPRQGMTRLHSRRISRASAEQRAGRAGRLSPGVAFRLWSEEQHRQLAAFEQAEILQSDLAPVALQLLQWGVSVDELQWLDAPKPAPWQQALDLLRELGACDDAGLTRHGEAMAALPLHPRLAHMILRARDLGLSTLASEIAALLSERDPDVAAGCDIAQRLPLHRIPNRQASKRLQQQARQFRRLLGVPEEAQVYQSGFEGLCVALAYPERIAKQREPGGTRFQLCNGRTAELPEADLLRKHTWLAIAHLGGTAGKRSDAIFLAAPFDLNWLGDALPAPEVAEVVAWQDNGQLMTERQHRLGRLVVRTQAAEALDEQATKLAILEWLKDKGLSTLPWKEATRNLQARVACLRSLDLQEGRESPWPDLSDTELERNVEQWLLPFLPVVTHLRHLQKVDVDAALRALLPWPLARELDELAPTHLTLATGSRKAIDYSQHPPVLAVKLQEMFGQRETPRIARNKLPLTLHLLSPAGHPLQVTQDLESFWRSSYQEVRKDMKGRYPKHPWPDDPMQAEPKRGTKKQGF